MKCRFRIIDEDSSLYSDRKKKIIDAYNKILDMGDEDILNVIRSNSNECRFKESESLHDKRAIFVLPNGTILIGKNEYSDHGDLMDDLLYIISHTDDDSIYELSCKLLRIFTRTRRWIRLNLGSTAVEKRCYAVFSEENRPTSMQFDEFENFLNLAYDKRIEKVLVYFGDIDPISKEFYFRDYLPTDIIRIIKRFYASGRLYENKTSGVRPSKGEKHAMKFRFRLIENILNEGTKYDKKASQKLTSSGLFDEETSDKIIQALFKEDIHAFAHSPAWLEKYLVGIARMIIEEADGDRTKAQRFLEECPSVFDEYLTWVKENREKIGADVVDKEFNETMHYQDVKNKLDKIREERDKESKNKLSQMSFDKKSDYTLVPIDSYEQMHKLYGGRATGDGSSNKYAGGGGTAWCHANSENTYDSWVRGDRKFFVLQNNDWQNIFFDEESNANNPKDNYGNSLIAILVNKKGRLEKATLRCNHVGAGSNADNQYRTYAELSEIAGFNVEEEVGKYIEVVKAKEVKISPDMIIEVSLIDRIEAEGFPEEVRQRGLWWWLQSRGNSRYSVAYVNFDGSIDSIGDAVDDNTYAVVPALILYPNSPKFKSLNKGDIIEVFGKRWYYNGDIMALLADKPLIHMAFRKDWRASDANDYEKSDVKKYLDYWFNWSNRLWTAYERGMITYDEAMATQKKY